MLLEVLGNWLKITSPRNLVKDKPHFNTEYHHIHSIVPIDKPGEFFTIRDEFHQIEIVNTRYQNIRAVVGGNEIAFPSKEALFGYIETLMNAAKLSVDPSKMIFKFAHQDGNPGVINANLDFSATPDTWVLAPPAGEVWDIVRLLVTIEDTGGLDAGSYGNGIALTNGIAMKATRGGAIDLIDFMDGQTVLTNGDWGTYVYDVETTDFGAGSNYVRIKWDFDRAGKRMRLNGDLQDRIEIALSDDLDGLLGHLFHFQGYKA